ncbi:Carboxylesterase NlhH [Clavibacter michiganensis subsp. michiganensis]|uniref:alpha/beta hydrolase n=1 Tax=Clavibacter michiganensis TaxID=28447 RepID=UPI000B64B49C|nr:alpha/beta hydrolase [Clavibacter michiganensis]MDO4099307.1 alpha/beta hydrolase [Clavibacter michiganensis]OUD88797.1 Carboxylesterase NlhH [Clavibacter michiganensis subsp. michiganensis]OUE05253.1 Carboxylesterase NlhH [Clavibacter michiganensis subsp. michiganensis]OUE13149.1 Carboxylesterase NlhH [Clavibacter michiganensis subsp. michiganensis]OUE26513.1 Carboxylesterase NlhH [Clavibacter michiganensis subsp. michiganensis]
MPIDPIVANLLLQLPPPQLIADPVLRLQTEKATLNSIAAQLAEPYPEVTDRNLVTIPVEGGDIELLIYTPPTPGRHTGYLFFFGGGFRGGSIHYDLNDGACRERCIAANAVVVAVGYRLAPKHPFPTALNDGYAALLWVAEHAEELGIDSDRLVIGGQSSGGNIAASLSLLARDRSGPKIALQLLEVAALDLTWRTQLHEYDKGYILEKPEINQITHDLFSDSTDAESPYVSPAWAEDLTNLPRAVILTSEFDLTRGSCELYARRLLQAGVTVTYTMAEGQIHASPALTNILPAARVWRDNVITALRSVTTLKK